MTPMPHATANCQNMYEAVYKYVWTYGAGIDGASGTGGHKEPV